MTGCSPSGFRLVTTAQCTFGSSYPLLKVLAMRRHTELPEPVAVAIVNVNQCGSPFVFMAFLNYLIISKLQDLTGSRLHKPPAAWRNSASATSLQSV